MELAVLKSLEDLTVGIKRWEFQNNKQHALILEKISALEKKLGEQSRDGS